MLSRTLNTSRKIGCAPDSRILSYPLELNDKSEATKTVAVMNRRTLPPLSASINHFFFLSLRNLSSVALQLARLRRTFVWLRGGYNADGAYLKPRQHYARPGDHRGALCDE